VALRHTIQKEDSSPVLVVGELELDLLNRTVKNKGEEVSLTPNEYELLKVFFQNAGKVLTHRQLLHLVWGIGYETDSHILRVNISNLRRKIEADPSNPIYITTESGVGYRFKAMDT
jgi:two-component system, OmpR family, KDP operon response regulator KdpE